MLTYEGFAFSAINFGVSNPFDAKVALLGKVPFVIAALFLFGSSSCLSSTKPNRL